MWKVQKGCHLLTSALGVFEDEKSHGHYLLHIYYNIIADMLGVAYIKLYKYTRVVQIKKP